MKIENGVLQSVVSADIPESGVFEIPEGVTSVGSSAFRGCKSLKEINILKSVTSIGARAFEGCISLKEIYIPESVTLIESDTFWECRSLKEIHIPEGITTIKYSAFWCCESLKEIHLPERVTSIGRGAFMGCSSLKEIHLPERVTSIGLDAFFGCKSLKSIKWGTAYYAVRCIDGYCMHILLEKQFQDYKILKCRYFPENDVVYVAEQDGYTAHGKSIRKAIKDVQFKILQDKEFKILQDKNTSKHIKRITEQGYMNANDYRLLTGACYEGTDYFLKSHNLTWDDTMSVQEVLKLTENQYGFEHFKEAAEQILQMT